MTRIRLAFSLVLVMIVTITAQADIYTLRPPDRDLQDLPHQYYYTWGIDWTCPTDEEIVGVRIKFNDIRDWTTEANQLYVQLLDSAAVGLTRARDNQASGNAFEGQGELLVKYENLPTTAQDLTYTLTGAQLESFSDAFADGNAGLGFDPDCHFYNRGIALKIKTAPVPAPAALLLGVMGLGTFAGISRKLR